MSVGIASTAQIVPQPLDEYIGGMATWAALLGIALTFLTACPLFLLHLMANDAQNCHSCAYERKASGTP